MELFQTIVNEKFPDDNPIIIEGYSAKKLNESTYLSIFGAYNYLIP